MLSDMVRPGVVAVDVGTDHGRLMVHLVKSGKIPRGYAADINALPLQKAVDLIATHGLQDSITTVLCDGLCDFQSDMVDDIIIAGMGGELIADILRDWPHTKSPDKHYILQPMTRPEKLREYLYSEGFSIIHEQGVCAAGKTYSVMVAAYTGQGHPPSDIERIFGGICDFADSDNLAYAEKVLGRLRRKINGLKMSGGDTLALEQLESRILRIVGEI